tara:strand:- start:116 stop:550 length:435 start_codon:yes stop_codon:yes gene_type:complete
MAAIAGLGAYFSQMYDPPVIPRVAAYGLVAVSVGLVYTAIGTGTGKRVEKLKPLLLDSEKQILSRMRVVQWPMTLFLLMAITLPWVMKLLTARFDIANYNSIILMDFGFLLGLFLLGALVKRSELSVYRRAEMRLSDPGGAPTG